LRLLPLSLLLCGCACAAADPPLRDQDAAAVRDMAAAWRPAAWEGAGEDPCAWPGLVCGVTSINRGMFSGAKTVRYIKSVTLRDVCQSAEERGLAVQCTIPESLEGLDLTEQVFLNGNGLHGEIPKGIGGMSALKALYLNGNALTGPIPAGVGKLVRLERLHLGGNHLTGSIPGAIGGCASLHVLELQNNKLAGPIPQEIGMLAELSQLDVSYNGLVGELPAELGKLHKLHKAFFNGNHLFGALPPEMFGRHMASLMKVDLRNNHFEGDIPIGVCTTPRLVFFEAEEGNELEGHELACDGRHGPHADEANREHCKQQLRESGLCVNVPGQGLHDEL